MRKGLGGVEWRCVGMRMDDAYQAQYHFYHLDPLFLVIDQLLIDQLETSLCTNRSIQLPPPPHPKKNGVGGGKN